MFEVGQVFLGSGENDERIAAAAVRRGRAKTDAEGRNWSGGGLVDVFDAKRDAMTLLSALGVNANAVQIVPGGPSFLHPGRAATLQFGPKTIVGWFALADMEGGTFTITNLGGIGGTAFTPIVNHPEVAILGLSAFPHRTGMDWRKIRAAADPAALALLRSSPD